MATRRGLPPARGWLVPHICYSGPCWACRADIAAMLIIVAVCLFLGMR